jgi:uncharacterized membrane protein YedE/YeeE
MRRILAALVAGALFGLGLVISHMIDPLKVLGFLDIAGDWDPSLAFVMAGAIPAAVIGVALGHRTRHPLFARAFVQPPRQPVNARLLTGAALFGAGWGLAGYCPGPALAALGNGAPGTVIFVAAMLSGMAGFRWLSGGRSVHLGDPASPVSSRP